MRYFNIGEAKNKSKMSNLYIVEEQKIVSLDLYRQLLKKGFTVIYESGIKAVNDALDKNISTIIITNLKGLKERYLIKNEISFFELDILKFSGTDAVLVDHNMNVLKHFPKPYSVDDIEGFFKEYALTTLLKQNEATN